MKRIVREYYNKLHANEFRSSHDKDSVLERHKLPNVTQEENDNMQSRVSIKGISFVVEKYSQKEF